MRPLRSIAFGIAIGTLAASCGAGTGVGLFEVQITLHNPAFVPPPVVSPPGAPGLPGGGGGQQPEIPPVVVAPGQPAGPTAPPDAPVAQQPSAPAPVPVQEAAAADKTPQLVHPQLARLAPRSICTSQTGGSASGSTVRVACSPGQYALIQPLGLPGTLARRATAWRYAFSPADPLPLALSHGMNLRIGTGTITALRVPHLDDLLDPMEMLVSF